MQNDKDDFNKQIILAEFLTLILSVGETLPISCFGNIKLRYIFQKLEIHYFYFCRIYEFGFCY